MTSELIPLENDERQVRIRRRIADVRHSLQQPKVRSASREWAECAEAVDRIEAKMSDIEGRLDQVPPIDVAVLGPSRHGKSTLLNALCSHDLLPTSDVKPCTASVLKLQYSPEWSLKVRFVARGQLVADWQEAVRDATDELQHQRGGADDINEDPRFVKSVLQRFLQLFDIDPDLHPTDLIAAVRGAKIPPEMARVLGKELPARARDAEGMKAVVERYLSTSDIYWTIVESCEISGPFSGWHPSLRLIDLPGTNDTDPQRAAVTNRMREHANAVAIVTSDSNIGPDIESWLRNSSVLSNFLEATTKRRQRLFIIRTKLDSYHPEIPDSLLEGATEEEERRIYLDALESYKHEQSQTYHAMLRDIASPKLPHGDDESSRRKRADLLSRMDDIQVFFVSALAHEVFAGRYSTTRRTRRQLAECFDDELWPTGVPALRQFLTEVSSRYLSDNFYEDLELSLESEVRQLAATFQKSIAAVRVGIAGGRDSLNQLVRHVEDDVLPWLSDQVRIKSQELLDRSRTGQSGIRHRLQQADAMSARRFEDKIRIWSTLHWASLRAAARKAGVHVTSRGQFIDINQDVCSVLVDDVLLAWAHFRDDLISEQITVATNAIAEQLNRRLGEIRAVAHIPEVEQAIDEISDQLMGITHQQRLELLHAVNAEIKKLESIHKPAYRIAQEEMSHMFSMVAGESGSGCSYRMQEHVQRQAPIAIERIRTRINALVDGSISELSDYATRAITTFGQSATQKIGTAISHVSETQKKRNEGMLQNQLKLLTEARRCLPGPSSSAA